MPVKQKILYTILCTLLASVFILISCSIVPTEAQLDTYDYGAPDITFTFEWDTPDDAYLTEFRERYNIAAKVSESRSDLEKVLAIADWANGLWSHDGENRPDVYDPITLIEASYKGENYSCIEYSIVIAAACNSIGIPARILYLWQKDVETIQYGATHTATEVWLKEYGKWVLVDGQWGMMPIHYNTPLSAFELLEALTYYQDELEFHSVGGRTDGSYMQWIDVYLYYFTVKTHQDDAWDSPVSDTFPRIVLKPIGAKEPTTLQAGDGSPGNAVYTSKVHAFYQKPVEYYQKWNN